jgi:predicted transcriptional regulator of viral defense system
MSVDINIYGRNDTMSVTWSATERLLALSRERGSLRAADVRAAGIHPEYLRRLVQQGLLEHVSRGLYVAVDTDVTEHHGLVQAATIVPNGVVCLLSALLFHNLGTQLPFEVWLAIDVDARRPRVSYPPLRIVRMSGHALTEGVETHRIEGARVRVFGVAKTVADCFKYRNKIGLDVALEALREAWREQRVTMDELWHYAAIDRVANVMRPYLESLV